MSVPKPKKKLTAAQLESYEVLREMRLNIIESIRIFNRMAKANNKEIIAHLEQFDDDPRLRASDKQTAVDGTYKLPMAMFLRASIKTLLDSLVVLDQRLAVFEGVEEDPEEEQRREEEESVKEAMSGKELHRQLLAAMDSRGRAEAITKPETSEEDLET